MRQMDRREFLKRATLFGGGAMAVSLLFGTEAGAAETQYFLITNHPAEDTRRLLRLVGVHSRTGIRVQSTPIRPSAQDLSLISGGRVMDPGRDPKITQALRRLTAELRNRPVRAHTLVHIAKEVKQEKNTARFEVDGHVVEQVDLATDYSNIVIPGVQGETTFRVRNGRLSVVTSSCRHHLCQKMGARWQGRIICAPNKLVASVSGGRSTLDGITG